MSINFYASDAIRLNEELQEKARAIIEEGKNPVTELAQRILFVETASHHIEMIERDAVQTTTHPRIAKAIQEALDGHSTLIERVLVKQMAEEQIVTDLDQLLSLRSHPFVTKLDATRTDRLCQCEDTLALAVEQLPYLTELQIPADCEYFIVPPKASLEQLLEIPRRHPHLKKLNLKHWRTFDEVALNEIIPQLKDLTTIEFGKGCPHIITVPCKADSRFFREIRFHADGVSFTHWQYADQFWFFIEKSQKDARELATIAHLLGISEDINQRTHDFIAAHVFVLHRHLAIGNKSSYFNQAITALQALHPHVTIDRSRPAPSMTTSEERFAFFLQLYPGLDLSKLATDCRSIPRFLIESPNLFEIDIKSIENVAEFSKHCQGQQRLTNGQLLRSWDLHREEIAFLKTAHPHLFAEWKPYSGEHSLEMFFADHPNIDIKQLITEYNSSSSNRPEGETQVILEEFIAIDDLIRSNRPGNVGVYSLVRLWNNPTLTNCFKCLASHGRWPKNETLQLYGLYGVITGPLSWHEFFTHFGDTAADPTPLQSLMRRITATVDTFPPEIRREISDFATKMTWAIDLEAAIARNDTAAVDACMVQQWTHTQRRTYFDVARRWKNDDLKARIEARMVLEYGLSWYFMYNCQTVPIEKLVTALQAKDPQKFRTLLRNVGAQFFQDCFQRFPQQHAGIMRLKEEWHRTYVWGLEAATHRYNVKPFIHEHPDFSQEDLNHYYHDDNMVGPFLSRLKAAFNSNRMREALMQELQRPENTSVARSQHRIEIIEELLFPMADRKQDAIGGLILWIGFAQADVPKSLKQWLRLLSRTEYDDVYREVAAILPAGRMASLRAVDAEVRPTIGAADPPLNLQEIENRLDAQFTEVRDGSSNRLLSTLDDRLFCLMHIGPMHALLSKIMDDHYPRRNMCENYSLSLLNLLYYYRAFDLETKTLYYENIGKKLGAVAGLYSVITEGAHRLRTLSKTLTPVEHREAYAAVENVLPNELKGILRELDTRVRFEVDPAHYARGVPLDPMPGFAQTASPTAFIDKTLHDLRKNCVYSPGGIRGTPEAQTHATCFLQAHDHGILYGIQHNINAVLRVADNEQVYDDERAVNLFRGAYNPGAIYAHIERIRHFSEFKEAVLTLHNTVPAGWQPPADTQREIDETTELAQNLLASASTDEFVITELRKLGINCPAPKNRTPSYRTDVRAAIDAVPERAAAFKKEASEALAGLITSNSTDTEIFTALSALHPPRGVAFNCPHPASQLITSPHRAEIANSIEQYKVDALLAAYRATEVFDEHGNPTPEAILSLLVNSGVLRRM